MRDIVVSHFEKREQQYSVIGKKARAHLLKNDSLISLRSLHKRMGSQRSDHYLLVFTPRHRHMKG